jgi:hypothetical protein
MIGRTQTSVRTGSQAGKPEPKVIITPLHKNIFIIPEQQEKVSSVFGGKPPCRFFDRVRVQHEPERDHGTVTLLA